MSAMKILFTEIEELLDTTNLLCDGIAEKLGCPVSFVNDVVEQRWNDRHLQPELYADEFAIQAYAETAGA